MSSNDESGAISQREAIEKTLKSLSEVPEMLNVLGKNQATYVQKAQTLVTMSKMQCDLLGESLRQEQHLNIKQSPKQTPKQKNTLGLF